MYAGLLNDEEFQLSPSLERESQPIVPITPAILCLTISVIRTKAISELETVMKYVEYCNIPWCLFSKVICVVTVDNNSRRLRHQFVRIDFWGISRFDASYTEITSLFHLSPIDISPWHTPHILSVVAWFFHQETDSAYQHSRCLCTSKLTSGANVAELVAGNLPWENLDDASRYESERSIDFHGIRAVNWEIDLKMPQRCQDPEKRHRMRRMSTKRIRTGKQQQRVGSDDVLEWHRANWFRFQRSIVNDHPSVDLFTHGLLLLLLLIATDQTLNWSAKKPHESDVLVVIRHRHEFFLTQQHDLIYSTCNDMSVLSIH